MNTTLSRFNEARIPLEDILAAVPDDRWSAPSHCEGWSARDVLAHVIGTQRDFFTERGLDVGNAPDLNADPAAAWRSHAQRIETLLEDDAVAAEEYEGFFGPATVGGTFEQFYVWDMLVHRWDIAMAVGVDPNLSNEELDAMDEGADTFGENLYMEGICKPGVAVDSKSDRRTKVLARLGRRA